MVSLLPLVISHAACKGHAPENTLAGIRAALAMGVDAIEIDVHCSSDGTPVLIHDASLERTTDGAGSVAGLSLEQLRRLDAGCRAFDGAFAGERIPLLAEALDLTRGRCLLVVEIKAEGIERAVAGVIGEAPDDVMVWSFRPEAVARMRELAPAVPCARLAPALAGPPNGLLAEALAAGLQAVSVHHTSVDEALVRTAALRGLTVYAWTADDPADHRRLVDAGAAGIVTNVPDVLLRGLGRWPALTRPV
jgi:glycerophosphoryl diester phosphodiesterase